MEAARPALIEKVRSVRASRLSRRVRQSVPAVRNPPNPVRDKNQVAVRAGLVYKSESN